MIENGPTQGAPAGQSAPSNAPAAQPAPAPETQPVPPAPQEVSARAAATIQRMKEDLVQFGAMLQWEADHLFEGALKHLNNVSGG